MDLKKSLFQFSLKAAVIIFFINAFAIIDSNIRTLEYTERADQYSTWHKTPLKKKTHFEKDHINRIKKLKQLFEAKKISENKYDMKMENLIFLKKFKIKESSAKYAYYWNKKANETFTGLFILGKQNLSLKAAASKQVWVRELEEKKIKFKNYMVD
ncbi:MAG: hypothetical protein U9Q34_07785 [Elusimicrobiota bacterium]|nr:hypothetical protein [Elusimicrobiota bacterium]